MFKKVERSEEKESTEVIYEKKLYKVEKYRVITCTDFNDQKREIKEFLEQRLEELTDSNKKYTKITKKYKKTDEYRWYDYLSLTITRWFRKIDLYEY